MATSTESSIDSPLRSNRSFHGHVAAQYCGAFNDNLFKQLILFLAARELFPDSDKQGVATAVFALPFVVFSGVAGDISERYSKRTIIVAMKVAETVIMLTGALALQQRSWAGLLVVLFVMGTHSAFFGPSKYGIIPELVGKMRLLSANGIVSMTTFLSIVLGQALAGPLLDRCGTRLWITGAWCVGIAVVGTIAALRIRKVPALRPNTAIRPFGSLLHSARELRNDPRVVRMLVLNATFWFNGGVIQQAVVGLGAPQYLAIPKDANSRLSMLLVSLATSIVVGSLCVPLAARVVRLGKLVAFGAISMLGCQAALAVTVSLMRSNAYLASLFLVSALGFTGAFFVVPVQTFLQYAPESGTRGKTFAVNNFLNFLCVFFAGAFYMLCATFKLHPGIASTLSAIPMCALLLAMRQTVLSIQKPGAVPPAPQARSQ